MEFKVWYTTEILPHTAHDADADRLQRKRISTKTGAFPESLSIDPPSGLVTIEIFFIVALLLNDV